MSLRIALRMPSLRSPRWNTGLAVMMGLSFSVLAPGRALAQSEAQPQPRVVQMQDGGSRQDGGTREVLESIFVPPKPNAPFSLQLVTEWSRPLGNGGSYTLVNQRRIMRDTQGRIYEERWGLVPKDGKTASPMTYIQIADPGRHTLYNCRVMEKTCFLLQYAGSIGDAYKPSNGPSGALPNGDGFRTSENLGTNDIQGLETTGFRETTTINPGVYGNDREMVTTREFWHSAQLGINLVSKLDSPKSGKQSFTVAELSTAEPDAQFFAVPEGYKVIDQRKTEPASN